MDVGEDAPSGSVSDVNKRSVIYKHIKVTVEAFNTRGNKHW